MTLTVITSLKAQNRNVLDYLTSGINYDAGDGARSSGKAPLVPAAIVPKPHRVLRILWRMGLGLLSGGVILDLRNRVA